jgi:PKD repeat protein
VATSLKLAEWHADYGSSGFIDATGCGGSGGGFPIYTYGDTYTNMLMEGNDDVGFEIVQDFRMSNWGASCNYRYEQRHQFYEDGRFRVVAGAFGKGCGVNALYRPIVRMDLAVDGDTGDTVSIWDGTDWDAQDTEFYRTPYAGANGPNEYNPDGYAWRIDDAAGAGYYIEPAQGQFELGDRKDYPFFYVTLHKPAEGDTDLPVIGSCCLDDHRQGPHNYVDGENIDSANLVLWYVSHMTTTVNVDNYYCWTIEGEPNPETYPCWSGPMFVPAEPLTPTAPSAAFVAGSAYVGVPTSFQNSTFGSTPISYEWDFGDGATSTLESPEHTYSTEGQYTVWLTATNSLGSDSYSQVVNVEAAIEAAFSTNGTNFTIGAPVEFTNLSDGPGEFGAITSHWDFGDGEESTANEPIHAYDAAGEYTVTLTVENDVAIDVATKVLTIDSNVVAPTASFSHNTAYNGVPVQFSNMSGGTSPLTYVWDFGDGVGTSSLANPSYTYEMPGAYTVELTVTNKAGSSATSDLLQVQAAVDADFTTSAMNEAGETVHFYNETTGYQPINYLWRLGDGVSSNGYDVNHSYDDGSHYLVRLSAANTVMTDEVSLWVNVADDMETLGPNDSDKLQGDGISGGKAELDVPEGTMDTVIDLFFTVFNQLPGLSSRGGQLSFMDLGATLEAYDNGVLQPDLMTDEPMTLLFEYEDILTEGADPGSVAVLYWNGSDWIDAADTCAAPGTADNDSDNQEISVPVCKVGHYAVFYLTVEHTIYLPLVAE